MARKATHKKGRHVLRVKGFESEAKRSRAAKRGAKHASHKRGPRK